MAGERGQAASSSMGSLEIALSEALRVRAKILPPAVKFDRSPRTIIGKFP